MEADRRSTIAIWVVAGALAVFAGVRIFGGGDPAPAPVRIDGGPGAAASAAAPRPAKSGAEVYVHVAGAVRRPGLIRLAADSRVSRALARAGGPTRRANLTLVNLAAKVQDGQQIVVPVTGQATSATAQAAGSSVPGAQIHLSTATVDQLDEIDGIGPTLAERIIEYRDANGGFGSLNELSEVDGIGEKRLATLRDALQP